jgi:DNA-binding NarL/FixJ family response regulator
VAVFTTNYQPENQETLSADPSGQDSAPHPSPAAPHRVLLVDDDPKTIQLLRSILEHYEDIAVVGDAGDGQEAVVMASTLKPDVIVMDIALPGFDGIEATHRIKHALPRTAVIGLAGHFSTQTYNAMRTAGAAAFMCKNQLLAIHETILFSITQG